MNKYDMLEELKAHLDADGFATYQYSKDSKIKSIELKLLKELIDDGLIIECRSGIYSSTYKPI